jgi:predicted nucleic acid-binding protein
VSGLFIDTSGWAEFLVRTEPFHDQAVFLMDHARKNKRAIVTTNYVIAELTALLTSPMRVPRQEQIRIVGTLRSASWISVLRVSPVQDEAVWNLLATHNDNEWSLVDCASFVVMREHVTSVALTTDSPFRTSREKFGIDASTRVEFEVVDAKPAIRKWRGKCAGNFAKQGYSPGDKSSVDKFMNDVRGKL